MEIQGDAQKRHEASVVRVHLDFIKQRLEMPARFRVTGTSFAKGIKQVEAKQASEMPWQGPGSANEIIGFLVAAGLLQREQQIVQHPWLDLLAPLPVAQPLDCFGVLLL